VLSDADMCWHVLQIVSTYVWLGTLYTTSVCCRLVSAAIALACVSVLCPRAE
jgi:hypothetical protein